MFEWVALASPASRARPPQGGSIGSIAQSCAGAVVPSNWKPKLKAPELHMAEVVDRR